MRAQIQINLRKNLWLDNLEIYFKTIPAHSDRESKCEILIAFTEMGLHRIYAFNLFGEGFPISKDLTALIMKRSIYIDSVISVHLELARDNKNGWMKG